MNELNDELLNKYIDGDLNKETNNQVKARLESSAKDMLRYRLLLSVHKELKQMPVEEVSPDFTSGIMLKVQRSLKSKREQNFFIVSVLSLFLLIAIGIIGYLLSNFIFLSSPGSQDGLTQFTQHSEDLLTLIRNLFSKGNISIIGSVFSFILLISGYFFYESLKHSRQH